LPTDDDDGFFGYFSARNCLNERILFGFFFWEIVLLDGFGIYKGSFYLLDGIAFVYLASHQRGQCFCSDQCGAGERGRLSDTPPQSIEINGKTTAGFQRDSNWDSSGKFPESLHGYKGN
jgi:hypothetical protein